MTDLELFLSILCGILAFLWHREHEKRVRIMRVLDMLHMLMRRVGMGHATIVRINEDEFTIKPTEAGIKAAFEEITLP